MKKDKAERAFVRDLQVEIAGWLDVGHSVEDVIGVLEGRRKHRRGWRRKLLEGELARVRGTMRVRT